MFLRLVILFGALVAIPLAVSGVLLSFIGRSSVLQVGNDVTETSAGTMRDSSERLIGVATNSFTRSADTLIEQLRQQLEDSHQQQVKMSTQTLRQLSEGLKRSGTETLKEAINQVASDSRLKITQSSQLLREKEKAEVGKLGDKFTARVREVFKQTAQQFNDLNRKRMEELVTDINAARVESIALRARADITDAQRTLTEVARRLQEGSVNRTGVKMTPQAILRYTPPYIINVAAFDVNGQPIAAKAAQAEEFLEEHPFHRQALKAVQSGAPLYVSSVVFPDEESRRPVPMLTMALPLGSPEKQTVSGQPLTPTGFLIADLEIRIPIGPPGRFRRVRQEPAEKETTCTFIVDEKNKLVISHSDRSCIGREVDSDFQEVVQQAFKEKDVSGTNVLGKTDAEQRIVAWHRINVPNAPNLTWVVVSTQSISDLAAFTDKMRSSIDEAANKAAEDTEQALLRAATDAMRQFTAEQEQWAKQAEDHIRTFSTAALEDRLKRLETAEQKVVKNATDTITQQGQQVKETLVSTLATRLEEKTKQEAQQMKNQAEVQVKEGVRDIQHRTAQMANKPAKRMLKNSLLLIAFFLVLAVGLAAATAKSIVAPVEQLLDGTTALAGGNYSKRVSVKSKDEMGLLAAGFNDMATAVERSCAELERTNERLEEEKERIQHIIEGIPDGVMMVDHHGEVVFANSAVRRMLHLTATPNGSEHFSLRDAALQPYVERVEAALREPQTIMLERPRKLVLRLRAVPIRDEEGQPGRLLLLHDVTREHEVDEMKNSFIALVSHELRTPLTSILAFSSYMLTEKLGPMTDAQKTGVESMYRQAKRLSAIISDFLDVSRIESGKVQMQKQPIEVDQVVQRVIEELRPQATEKQIAMVVEKPGLPKNAHVVALADEQRIAQVLTNLLGNALKFTDANGNVNVSLASQNGSVLVSVSDTGCGIPQEELSKIFDRFYQVERVVTRKTGGTGLGLAIVKNIVEAHGGKVWVNSKVGQGTTFYFTLPR
jgi:PAS domain S-box-containing protein